MTSATTSPETNTPEENVTAVAVCALTACLRCASIAASIRFQDRSDAACARMTSAPTTVSETAASRSPIRTRTAL